MDVPIKRKIKEATLAINQTKSIHDITINEIARKLNISRSTFYRHYGGIYAVIEEVEQELFEGLRNATSDLKKYRLDKHHLDNPFHIGVQIFEFIHRNKETFKILLSENGDHGFRCRYAKFIETTGISKIISDFQIPKYKNLITVFLVNGIVSLVEEWLCNCPEITPAELERIYTKLIYGPFQRISFDETPEK